MGSASRVLPFPVSGMGIRAKTTVEHRDSLELALVRRVQAGEEAAFRDLVERYQGKVFSIIYGILRQRNDAEDIAQQVFAKAYFSIRSFDGRSSLLTWLYKITVNECYDYLRKKKVRRLVYESDVSEEDARRMAQNEPGRDLHTAVDEAVAQRDLVVKLLARLPQQERSLLLLKEVEGHSVEELAEMTGLNENTVKVKLFRARQRLLKLAQRLSGRTRLAVA